MMTRIQLYNFVKIVLITLLVPFGRSDNTTNDTIVISSSVSNSVSHSGGHSNTDTMSGMFSSRSQISSQTSNQITSYQMTIVNASTVPISESPLLPPGENPWILRGAIIGISTPVIIIIITLISLICCKKRKKHVSVEQAVEEIKDQLMERFSNRSATNYFPQNPHGNTPPMQDYDQTNIYIADPAS